MIFIYLIVLLIVQMAVRYGILAIFPTLFESIYGILAYYMISSLIISFVVAFLLTPPGYKKEFYKQPGFHKLMLRYFLIFFGIDLIFNYLPLLFNL